MPNIGPIISLAACGKGALYSPQMNAMFYTTDFARTWTPVDLARGIPVTGISIADSGFGLAATVAGLFATVDFGRTWQRVPAETAPTAVAVSGEHGSAARAGGRLLATSDGGRSWSHVDIGKDGYIANIRFGAGNRCYVLVRSLIPDAEIPDHTIREQAYLIWESRQRRAPYEARGFESHDQLGDWILAQRLLSRRTALVFSDDGWRSWHTDSSTETRRPTALEVFGETLIIMRDDGTLEKRCGYQGTWQTLGPPPFEDPWAIWAASDELWFVPNGYSLARTENGGGTWELVSPRMNLVSGTCFVSPTHGFTTSGNYSGTFSVAESTDAGKSWSIVHD
jgi:hypothetical protein